MRTSSLLVAVILFISFLHFSGKLSASVITYPAPQGTESSPYYTVEITQEGKTHNPFVYVSHAQLPKFNRSKSTSYSIFSFDGPATIKVTKLEGNFKSCKILPSSYGITPTTEGKSIVFHLDKPRKVAVEFDNDITHPLLLFADEPETDIPQSDDPNVIYFGPGVHTPTEAINPKAGQTIYLAGGSIVNAHITGKNASNVTIRGKGILNGRKFGHTHGRLILFDYNSENVTVKDITIVDAPGFYVTTSGNKTHIKNVKGLGWWFNTDGFSTGTNGLIEDCFIKCNDDAIKLYRSGTQVYRTTIWQMENGAPFQISWNMNSDNNGFVAKDCDIIHCDHFWDNTNTAVFNSIHGGGGHMSNYLFEDIRIENCDFRFFSLQIRPNKHANSKTLGEISNITFRNISLTTPDGQPLKRLNLIQGAGSEHTISDINFENVTVNGIPYTNAKNGGFELEPNSTSSIRFKADSKPIATQKIKNAVSNRKSLEWTNPLWNTGLNSYGAKDFFIWNENGKYYLLSTEVPNIEWGKRGIILYVSNDMVHWREDAYLLNRQTIDGEAWYRDGLAQPEMHKYKGKYYLTFNSYNEKNDPYGRLGLCIAVSENLHGPFKVLTTDGPLCYGANTALLIDNDKAYAYWDLDGRFYTAQLDLEKGRFATKPAEFLGPTQMGEEYRFLDAPTVFKRNNTYYLISSSFYAGYKIRVRYFTSKSPEGPWVMEPENLMYWIESEADMNIKMPWPGESPYPPPTQVVFHHHVFKGPGGKDFIAYHSSEKYSEPYLVIEPLIIDKNGKLVLPANKQPFQKITF